MYIINMLKNLTGWVNRLSTKTSLFKTLWASLSATTQQVGLADFTESAAL